jgi:hypothetical protein
VDGETGRLEVGLGTPFTTSPILSNPSWKGGDWLPPVGNWDNGASAAKSLRDESYLENKWAYLPQTSQRFSVMGRALLR